MAAARREGLDDDGALESVQDALLTFVASTESADDDDPERVKATVLTMVRNAARNRRRRHHRAKPHVPLAVVPEGTDRGPGAPVELRSDDDALAALAHAEDVVRLRSCVSTLCGVQRAVVLLRLLDERSGEDVAETLGITRGHVDVLVHRAKAALRVCMRESHGTASSHRRGPR